jgi:pimeloyl-ACP methyl ester carboxylesterase
MAGSEQVVLVHGLWMSGTVFGVLRHRLEREFGFRVSTFSYPTLHGDMDHVARDLAEFAARAGAGGRVHFVGHSLGGVVVYRMLRDFIDRGFGDAVLLGSPLRGSRAARNASQWSMLRPLLGPHVLGELMPAGERRWSGPNRVGSIAGSLRVGTGQFFAHFDEDNDGTVGVSETIIGGLSDHLVLPHSHIGMLFAEDVATQVASFLRAGHFLRAPPPSEPPG